MLFVCFNGGRDGLIAPIWLYMYATAWEYFYAQKLSALFSVTCIFFFFLQPTEAIIALRIFPYELIKLYH